MTPTPTALGMHLCDHLIIEEGTKKVSLIGCFDVMRFAAFPSSQRSYFVSVELTDGAGTGFVELVVARQDTGAVAYRHSQPIRFPDRIVVVQYGWKVTDCTFPAPGRYEFTLLVDGEWVAQRTVDVFDSGVHP